MKALASKITILIVFITISSQLSMADNISTLIPKIKDAIFTVYAEDEQQNIFSSGRVLYFVFLFFNSSYLLIFWNDPLV